MVHAAVTLRDVTETVVRHAGNDRTPLITWRIAMLPLPPIRISTSSLRRFARRIDAYTLWAFNPQSPLGR
jgi:hypothetical protein